MPVLGIGIGPVSVSPILQPIPVGHDTFVTTANAVCWLFTRSRKWSYIDGATEPRLSI